MARSQADNLWVAQLRGRAHAREEPCMQAALRRRHSEPGACATSGASSRSSAGTAERAAQNRRGRAAGTWWHGLTCQGGRAPRRALTAPEESCPSREWLARARALLRLAWSLQGFRPAGPCGGGRGGLATAGSAGAPPAAAQASRPAPDQAARASAQPACPGSAGSGAAPALASSLAAPGAGALPAPRHPLKWQQAQGCTPRRPSLSVISNHAILRRPTNASAARHAPSQEPLRRRIGPRQAPPWTTPLPSRP